MSAWEQVEQAVQAAICKASGLRDGQVIWAHQNKDAPANPYIKLSLGGPLTVGFDWLEKSYDPTRPLAEAIKVEVKGWREVALELEAFTDQVLGSSAAKALAERARTGLRLPSARAQLHRASVSPFDPGPVNWVPDVAAINFRGRAVCSIRCYMPAPAVAEFITFIEKTRIGLTVHGGGIDPETRSLLIPKG